MIIYKMKNFFVLTRNAEFEWKYHDSECDLMRKKSWCIHFKSRIQGASVSTKQLITPDRIQIWDPREAVHQWRDEEHCKSWNVICLHL